MDTRQLFRDQVKAHGGAEKVAGMLGCSRAYVDMLCTGSGDKLPSLKMARAIDDLFGIPMRAWSEVPRARDAETAPANAPSEDDGADPVKDEPTLDDVVARALDEAAVVTPLTASAKR